MPANPKPMTSADPRTNLEHLPDANLYDIARNSSAIHRMLALRMLVERNSLYAGRDDVADEARELIVDNPLTLKKVDLSAAVQALRPPSLIEMNQQKLALDEKLDTLRAEHAADTCGVSERLLLERSLWRKLTDWGKKNVLAVRRWSRKD